MNVRKFFLHFLLVRIIDENIYTDEILLFFYYCIVFFFFRLHFVCQKGLTQRVRKTLEATNSFFFSSFTRCSSFYFIFSFIFFARKRKKERNSKSKLRSGISGQKYNFVRFDFSFLLWLGWLVFFLILVIHFIFVGIARDFLLLSALQHA